MATQTQTHTHAAETSNRPGLSPEVFGLAKWASIDATVYGLPDVLDDTLFSAVKDEMSAMRYTLPCKQCRDNYAGYYDKNEKSVIKTKASVANYYKTLRNAISEGIHKPVRTSSDLARLQSIRDQRTMLILLCCLLAGGLLTVLLVVILRARKQ